MPMRLLRERCGDDMQVITPAGARGARLPAVAARERRPRSAAGASSMRSAIAASSATGASPTSSASRPRRSTTASWMSSTSSRSSPPRSRRLLEPDRRRRGVNIIGAGLSGKFAGDTARRSAGSKSPCTSGGRIRVWRRSTPAAPSTWRWPRAASAGRSSRACSSASCSSRSPCAGAWCTSTTAPPRCSCMACGLKKSSIRYRAPS